MYKKNTNNNQYNIACTKTKHITTDMSAA